MLTLCIVCLHLYHLKVFHPHCYYQLEEHSAYIAREDGLENIP